METAEDLSPSKSEKKIKNKKSSEKTGYTGRAASSLLTFSL